jgi:NAD/NADP transhydrogenase beta subunit
MPAISSPSRPATFDADERLRWVEHVARLMDSQFRLPGTRFRFGLDPLLGLLPIVGDLSSTIVSVALLLTMMRHGASGAVVVRMGLNILLDTVVGAIPFIGNVFDFAYKSNERNVALLRRHYAEGRHTGSGKGLVALVLLGLVVVLGLVVWGGAMLVHALWQYFEVHPIGAN